MSPSLATRRDHRQELARCSGKTCQLEVHIGEAISWGYQGSRRVYPFRVSRWMASAIWDCLDSSAMVCSLLY